MQRNPDNERIKHEYFSYLQYGRGLNEQSIDAVAKALSRFEDCVRFRDFKRFHRQQAIAFKNHLANQLNLRTKERLSKATIYSTLSALKAFFLWLAAQPGYKSHLHYSDADYFSLSLKETAIAKATREQRVPSAEQIRAVLDNMSDQTDLEKRNRALIAFTFLTGARDSAIASLRLRHIDLDEGVVHHDARDMRVKFSKSFPTYFFPVGDDIRQIFVDWVGHLKMNLGFGLADPLFPATRSGLTPAGVLAPIGLSKECWSTTGPIRSIFQEAFLSAGFEYFNPHSFRKTLVRLGMERCRGSAEAFKAWSQNLGHDEVLTTFNSYGDLPAVRQRDLIRSVTDTTDEDRRALEIGRAALAAAKGT